MMSTYLRRGIGDTASLVLRNLIRYQRRPDAILLVLVQPLILVLLFRYTIGGAIRIPGTSYVNYLMPAAFAVAIVNASATLGIGVAEDLTSGMVDRLRALPIARSSFLLGPRFHVRVDLDTDRAVERIRRSHAGTVHPPVRSGGLRVLRLRAS
jgi:hypothetical protein